eukprot:m.137376 g.137376  ORF g.137376 m.137376 type:complete len:471 (+) comp13148_c0_seq32:17-1429(+)
MKSTAALIVQLVALFAIAAFTMMVVTTMYSSNEVLRKLNYAMVSVKEQQMTKDRLSEVHQLLNSRQKRMDEENKGQLDEYYIDDDYEKDDEKANEKDVTDAVDIVGKKREGQDSDNKDKDDRNDDKKGDDKGKNHNPNDPDNEAKKNLRKKSKKTGSAVEDRRMMDILHNIGLSHRVRSNNSVTPAPLAIEGEAEDRDPKPYGAPFDENPKKDPKVLCLVLTTFERHDPKAIAVNKTWLPYCDGFAFMTDKHDDDLPTVVLPILEESRQDLWLKTRLSLLYAYTKFIDEYDWFLKADDDTFVIVENLKEMLSHYDPLKKHFFGRAFVYKRNHPEYEVIYPSGGAGYVLSQASLRAVGENPKLLKAGGAVEDMELARILRKLDIHIEDTRDSEGRERFLPFRLDQLRKHFTRVAYPTLWFWAYSYFYPKEGMQCCSKRWITSHYAYSSTMYEYHQKWLDGTEGKGKDPSDL